MGISIETIKASQLAELTEVTDSNYVVVTDGDTSKKIKATNFKGDLSNINEKIDSILNEKSIINEKIDSILNEKSIYYASSLGFKFDGSDETETLRRALNFKDNIKIIFPSNETVIITEPIISNYNSIEIIGNNTKIKVMDNCDILNRMSNREFIDNFNIGILELYGDNIIINKLQVDVNCFNNYYQNGEEKWYQFSTNHGATSLPSGKKDSGFIGIHLKGNNCIVEYCTVENSSWGGINFDSKNKPIKTTNHIIRFNTVKNCFQDAIDFMNVDGIKVYGNKIINNYYHGIHAYNSVFNADIYDNNIYFSKDFSMKSVTPNAQTSELYQQINIAHSLYPSQETKKIRVYNNNIENYSSLNGSVGITIQELTFVRDVYIRNNYIYNFYTGIVLDIYNYGNIEISNNNLNSCISPIVLRLGVLDQYDAGLPSFTTETPNCKILIKYNSLTKCQNYIKTLGINDNLKHEEYTTGAEIIFYNNRRTNNTTIPFLLHSDIFNKVTLTTDTRSKNIIPLDDWTITSGYRNKFYTDYDRNIVTVNFDISGGTSNQLFYIEKNKTNETISFPCVFKVADEWISAMAYVDTNGKVTCGNIKPNTSRIVGNFSFSIY